MEEITNQTLHAILLEVKDTVKNNNGRLRKVEKKVWAMTGGLVVIAIIVVPLFIDLLK